MASSDRVEVPGSDKSFDPSHPRVGDIDPSAESTVTVYLRPSSPISFPDDVASLPPQEQRRPSRQEWAQSHGAREEDIAAVSDFAAEYGLTVAAVDRARRSVQLRGPVGSLIEAFGAGDVALFDHGSGTYLGRQGSLTVPSAIGEVITGVYGVDDRPQARPHFRRRASAATSYTAVQVAKAYDFPASVDGAGQTIAILELGGGYKQADLDTYFSGLGLTSIPVSAVSVDGASNAPGVDTDADTEVLLDIEVAGSVANGAKVVVYFAPNTDQGFIDAVSTAVHDTTNHPSVLSISWGDHEDTWTAQARTEMEQILTEAATLGVTVTVAAGDNGSTDGATDGKQHVDFPASAPHALGCGGTSLHIKDAKIGTEVVWNDGSTGGTTGGGVSTAFPVPSYQSSAGVPNNVDTGQPGRGVPDVAGNADPATGYKIVVDGASQVVGGTSAVAPLWAGLVACLNQSAGADVGFLNTRLYASSLSADFHDITSGNNGAYSAGPGWDACTGLGSPNGSALAQGLA